MTEIALRSLVSAFTHPATTRQRYAVGIACALLALTLHWVLVPIAGGRFPFLFFVPMLIVAASVAGRGPGTVVVVVAVASATLMVPPLGSLQVSSWRDQLMLVLFAIVGYVLVHFGSTHRLIGRKAADAEQRLALAQSAVGIGLFELDWVGQRILCSPSLWTLMGLPSKSTWVSVGEWRKPIHVDDLKTCLDIMEKNIAAGQPDYECEYRIHHPASGDVRWLLSRIHIERDAANRVTLLRGATADITHRRQLEAALVEADRRKDEFLATLAHELRNPLAPIRQAAVILKAPKATDAQKLWSQDVIERQVKHMALLLDDLLDISRITRGVLELRKSSIELSTVINTAVESVRGLLDERRHTLSVKLPSQPVWLNADGLRLSQLVTNLLSNAAKFTEPSGTVQLSATCAEGRLTLRIRDNGVGIAKDDLPTIFEMFTRGRKALRVSDSGLGVGLALVKGIVDLHGGSIEARSEGVGFGSEFIVHLYIEIVSDTSQSDDAVTS